MFIPESDGVPFSLKVTTIFYEIANLKKIQYNLIMNLSLSRQCNLTMNDLLS